MRPTNAFACVSASLPSYALGLTPSAQQRSTAPWSLFGRTHRRMGPSRARAQRERQRRQAALSAASCCRGLTPGRTTPGPVSGWPCRYLVGARAATRSLPLHHALPAVTHRAPSHFPHTHRFTLLNRPHPHVSQTNLLHQPVHGFELARGCAYRCAAPRLASSRLRHAAPGLAPGLKPGLAPGLAPEHGAVLGPQTRSRTRVPCRVVVTTHLPMPRRTTSRRTSSTYACSSATVASASRPCRWGRLRVG